MPFEVLHCPFVLLGCSARFERAQILSPPAPRVLLPRVKSIFAGFKFPDHWISFREPLECLIYQSPVHQPPRTVRRCYPASNQSPATPANPKPPTVQAGPKSNYILGPLHSSP